MLIPSPLQITLDPPGLDLFYPPSGALAYLLLVGCLPQSYQFNIN